MGYKSDLNIMYNFCIFPGRGKRTTLACLLKPASVVLHVLLRSWPVLYRPHTVPHVSALQSRHGRRPAPWQAGTWQVNAIITRNHVRAPVGNRRIFPLLFILYDIVIWLVYLCTQFLYIYICVYNSYSFSSHMLPSMHHQYCEWILKPLGHWAIS